MTRVHCSSVESGKLLPPPPPAFVEQNVDRAVGLRRLGYRSLDHLGVADVTGDEGDLAACGANGRFHCTPPREPAPSLLRAACHEHDARAFLRKQLDGRLADPTGPASDDRYLVIQSMWYRYPPL